ncbi:unnamed protein product [Lathyrus oleraceus]|uniref:Adenosine phosphate-isopentenyltransferase 4 n=2 Tax=Pisum sativum TaxID=3888 RepID=A0A0H3WD08_PEA|nr:adenosine phosphate-isopentenyltransferase 4 [Pisum sativum]
MPTTTPSFLSPNPQRYYYHQPIKFHHSSYTPSSATTCTMPHWPRMEIASSRHRRKDKVLVIMGATGSGKSRLSVELAKLFPCFEIINSDKIQVYRGLDITTNKIPFHQRNNVPHHLLGDVDPSHGEFSPSDFRLHAGDLISDISSRRKLPIIVGGSNSFLHALLVERFNPESNVFEDESSPSISSDLRYKCCFLWMDISFPVLSEYLLKRVDDMFDSGMVDELAEFYKPGSDNRTGLRKAIGVPEFDRFFKQYPPAGPIQDEVHNPMREGAYQEAVKAIKDNTCQLAKRQIGKILRLKRAGWDLRRLDATEAFRSVLMSDSHGGDGGGEEFSDIWKKQVLEPSVKIVKRFLME